MLKIICLLFTMLISCSINQTSEDLRETQDQDPSFEIISINLSTAEQFYNGDTLRISLSYYFQESDSWLSNHNFTITIGDSLGTSKLVNLIGTILPIATDFLPAGNGELTITTDYNNINFDSITPPFVLGISLNQSNSKQPDSLHFVHDSFYESRYLTFE
ncbi:MAG: hypothetical protein OCD01_09980 [Fibrobacterales bacterium]